MLAIKNMFGNVSFIAMEPLLSTLDQITKVRMRFCLPVTRIIGNDFGAAT